MDFFVYMLRTRDGGRRMTYVGWTTDLARRLAQHNAGSGARSTRGRAWALVHVEQLVTRQAAMSREWHLKRNRALRRQLAQAPELATAHALSKTAKGTAL